MTYIARFVSYFFHPMFMVAFMLAVLSVVNPFLFGSYEIQKSGLLIISVISLSIFFPLLSIFMMKALGLIESLEMKTDRERVGPLIVTGIFYLWLYVNIKDNPMVPEAFSFFVLGATIGLFIGFFMNQFTRISLHTIGIGGFLTGLVLIRYNFSYESFVIDFGMNKLLIQTDLLLIMTVIVSGLVGTSRLIMEAHKPDQIYGGYLVGSVAQIIAYMIFI